MLHGSDSYYHDNTLFQKAVLPDGFLVDCYTNSSLKCIQTNIKWRFIIACNKTECTVVLPINRHISHDIVIMIEMILTLI